jgi:two-component system cell cycle sensor histidine kinase/response regulator CckA
VVHGIVHQIGGFIHVESEPGKGAAFRLYFPVSSTAGVAEPISGAHPPTSKHGKVALLVEDDPLVRAMAARGLVEAGYSVLEAGHGRAALELVRSNAGQVDIVITDIGMPEMNGQELGRRLREERPDIPVLYMTGYGEISDVSPLLRKPFAPDRLVHSVNEVLRQPPQ